LSGRRASDAAFAGTVEKPGITITVIIRYTLDYIFLYFCLK